MSASCGSIWLGLLITLAADGALFLAARSVAARFWAGERASTRLAATLTLWAALILFVFYPLALTGLLTPWCALGASLLVAAAVRAGVGRADGAWGEAPSVAGWLRLLLVSRGAILVGGAGVLVLSAAYRAAVWPPLSYDSLTYHNFLAGSWVQAAGFVRPSLPPAMESYLYVPVHFEALVAWTMLPFHSDFLANFVNLPLLALGAIALYGLCRELELDLFGSSLAVGLVFFSPAVFAYVCTQYSDILVMSLLVGAALFLVRHLRGGRWADAIMAFLASGLAVGTKHTAIPPAAILCLVAISAPLGSAARRWRRATAALGLCVAIVSAAGGYAYIRNWVELGNPLYPATIRLFGTDLFRQAPVMSSVTGQVGRGTWRDDVAQLGRSISYCYGMQATPLVWGPKLPAIIVLAIVALVRSGRSARRAELRSLALCWAVPALMVYLDLSYNTAAIRRFWPDAFARFVAAPVALMAASALAGAALLNAAWLRRAVRGGLCLLLLYDLFAMSILPDTPLVLVIVGCGLAVALLVAVLVPRAPLRIPAAAWAALGIVAFAAASCGLHWVRDHWRNWFLEKRTELHPVPRHWAAGWALCDDPREPKVIALASYEPSVGHHWFFYPLMGRRLQNVVRYVPTGGDAGAWMSNLRTAGITHVFVQLNPELPPDDPRREPAEMAWIRLRPDAFKLVHQGAHYRIYEFLHLAV